MEEVAAAIWEEFSDGFLKLEKDEWIKIADHFYETWNFPNCIGAINGLHMMIQNPAHVGSQFYNYKNFPSFVLLAVCDANCKYVMVDIGAPGLMSDGGIFSNSAIGQRFYTNQMNLPSPRKVTENSPLLSLYLVGDEALENFMMRPFPKRCKLSEEQLIFNYRLSRARRTIECSFGILTRRFQVYQRPMIVTPKKAVKIVQAAVCLHNFILDRESPVNWNDNNSIIEILSQTTTEGCQRINQHSNCTLTNRAYIRNQLVKFFLEEGEVPWQWERIYDY